MGRRCKERHTSSKDGNKLEGKHQKTDQKEVSRWEGQNFSEVVVPREEEEEEEEIEEEEEEVEGVC